MPPHRSSPDGDCQFIHLCVRPDVRFPHDEKYRRPVLFQKAVSSAFLPHQAPRHHSRHKEQRNIRLFRCETCLFHAAFAQFALVAKSCRIYDNARAERMYLHRLVDRVGRRSRHIGDNGYLLSGKALMSADFPLFVFPNIPMCRRLLPGVSFNVTAITFFSFLHTNFPLSVLHPYPASSGCPIPASLPAIRSGSSLSLCNIMNVLVGGLLYLRIRNLLKLTVNQFHTDLFRLLARIILEVFFLRS